MLVTGTFVVLLFNTKGQPFFFIFAVYRAAYDVKLDDDNWPASNFTLSKGAGTAAWDQIAAYVYTQHVNLVQIPNILLHSSGTNVSYSYVMKPTKAGRYYMDAAVVNFRPAPKATPIVRQLYNPLLW